MATSRHLPETRIGLELAESPRRPLGLDQLTGYLGLLGAAYKGLGPKVQDLDLNSSRFQLLIRSRAQLIDLLRQEPTAAASDSLRFSREPEPVTVLRITFESPLKMVLGGSVVTLTLACTLSGGTIDISANGVRAHLPPIGEGISYLRESLGPQPVEIKLPSTATSTDSDGPGLFPDGKTSSRARTPHRRNRK